MVQAGKTVQKSCLEPRQAGGDGEVAGESTLAPDLRQAKSGEFGRARWVPGAAGVIDSELFTSMDTVVFIAGEFVPQFGSSLVSPLALGKLRELSRRARSKFGGQPDIECLHASGLRASGFSPAMKEA